MKILKTFWQRRSDGVWQGVAIKSLDLKGTNGAGDNLFPIQEDIVLTQATPGPGIPLQSIGTIRSFVGESVVPVVANVHGERRLRCVGTGFFVSCTGLHDHSRSRDYGPYREEIRRRYRARRCDMVDASAEFWCSCSNKPYFSTTRLCLLSFRMDDVPSGEERESDPVSRR